MRGEHSSGIGMMRYGTGSSPHARGTPASAHSAVVMPGIIPACAGNTGCPAWSSQGRGDHPRMRGEHQEASNSSVEMQGSSPHARGTLLAVPHLECGRGIIPACAGNTSTCDVYHSRRWDHPRMRGEHLSDRESVRLYRGSSPHARGTHYEKCRFPPIIISSFIFFIYFPFSRGKHGISITVVVRTRIASTDRI